MRTSIHFDFSKLCHVRTLPHIPPFAEFHEVAPKSRMKGKLHALHRVAVRTSEIKLVDVAGDLGSGALDSNIP